MYLNDMQKLCQNAAKKVDYMEKSPTGYVLLSAAAGIYVAFGIALILYIGAPLVAASSPVAKLLMGVSFGIALSLVIFAGSELFTGNAMFGLVGALSGQISWRKMARLWTACYLGNLVGSLFLAWLMVQSGAFSSAPQSDFILKVTAGKMSLSAWQIFVRGILANWLVCLAVWTAARTSDDTAKLVLIFWCLLGFVAPGFEHSVANMSAMGMGLFLPHAAAITWAGYFRNLLFSTVGNIVGGGVFVGGLYWLVNPYKTERMVAQDSLTMSDKELALSR